MRTIIIIALTILIIPLKYIYAQETDTTSKPKIGLVLSGGAAKGLAHIGVLKILEQSGIIPDYIAATSMGAVVGGMYSLGYTADEISELNSKADWSDLLSDRTPLNEVVFEEKYEYRRYIVGFPIRDYRFRLPSGVIEGQQLEKFFADLMWPMPKLESFDSLPIPFRCMAVDLIKGKLVEFNSGNLAETIRASMSIPSVFAPESIDSMLLVDGGVIRNFPVEEVRKMGADFVIGVYVGFEDKVTKEDLFSLSDVMSRATVFYGIYDSQEQMKLADIVIQPDLKGLGATDFNKSDKIELLGEEAALKIQGRLCKLADSLNLKYTPVKRIEQPDKILISDIDVTNTRFVKKDFVIGKSGIIKGSYVSKSELSEGVDNIFGTQYFNKVTYILEKQNDESYKLIFNVKESTRAFLNFAAHYDNKYGPGIITNLTLRNYLTPGSRATLTLNIAENPGIRLDMNKYVGKKQRIMNTYFLNWRQNTNLLYENGHDIGTYRHGTFEAGIGAKYSLATNHQLGVLGFYELNKIIPHENIRNYYSEVNFENYGFGGFAYKIYYSMNNTDHKFFPHRGTILNLRYKYNYKPNVKYQVEEDVELLDQELFRLNLNPFNSIYFNFDQYIGLFDKFIFNIGLSAGLTSDEAVVISNYTVGGYHWDSRTDYVPFSGLNYSEYVEPNFGIVKAGFDFEIIPRIYLSVHANMGFFTKTTDEFIPFVKNSGLNSYLKGYCAGLRIDSVIGPVNIMMGDNDLDKNLKWYISIGYPF